MAAAGVLTYAQLVNSFSPSAYWRLGESSGIVAADASGNGHNGTYTPNSGGAWTGGTLGTTGLITGDADTAATFNSTTGYVSTYAPSIGTGNFTAMGWIKTGSTTPDNETIFGNYNGAGFFLNVHTPSSTPFLQLFFAGLQVAGSTAIAANTRYFVVVERVGSNANVYLNNALEITFSVSSSSGGTGTFMIGQRGDGSSQFWKGDIDEVALFVGTAISTTDLTTIYNKGL